MDFQHMFFRYVDTWVLIHRTTWIHLATENSNDSWVIYLFRNIMSFFTHLYLDPSKFGFKSFFNICKVYNLMIWYTYTCGELITTIKLINISITSHSSWLAFWCGQWWKHLKLTLFANFNCTVQHYYLESPCYTSHFQNLFILQNWNVTISPFPNSSSFSSLPFSFLFLWDRLV